MQYQPQSLFDLKVASANKVDRESYLPPTKCLPLKYLINGFGAVKLTSTSGMNLDPGPQDGGPVSMSHDEGTSTAVMAVFVSSKAQITEGKGSRT
jgi:hypothetical protein